MLAGQSALRRGGGLVQQQHNHVTHLILVASFMEKNLLNTTNCWGVKSSSMPSDRAVVKHCACDGCYWSFTYKQMMGSCCAHVTYNRRQAGKEAGNQAGTTIGRRSVGDGNFSLSLSPFSISFSIDSNTNHQTPDCAVNKQNTSQETLYTFLFLSFFRGIAVHKGGSTHSFADGCSNKMFLTSKHYLLYSG